MQNEMITSSSPVVLHFTKLFMKGIFKNCTSSETMNFVSVQRAEDWLNGIAANHARGVLDYRIVDSLMFISNPNE